MLKNFIYIVKLMLKIVGVSMLVTALFKWLIHSGVFPVYLLPFSVKNLDFITQFSSKNLTKIIKFVIFLFVVLSMEILEGKNKFSLKWVVWICYLGFLLYNCDCL